MIFTDATAALRTILQINLGEKARETKANAREIRVESYVNDQNKITVQCSQKAHSEMSESPYGAS